MTAKARPLAKRQARIAAVHIAKKALALTDESYRDVIRRVTKTKESSATCTIAELDELLGEFKRLGWQGKRRRKPARAGGRQMATGGQAGKIRALWLSLYHLGEVRDPSEDAIAAFVTRQTGIDAVQWLRPDDAHKAIEALKDWCERAGFHQPDKAARDRIDRARRMAKLEPLGAGFAAKVTLINVIWRELIEAGAMKHGEHAHLGTWLGKRWKVQAPQFLTLSEADQAIEELGAWYRGVRADWAKP